MKLKDNYNGALQKPIGSGFNATSTAADVIKGIDLTGKTTIVTGGYAGIGLETVKAFVSAGARVIVPARDINKAEKNLQGIQNVFIETMDLMDPDSIDAFAKKFLTSNDELHMLVNNAGIMWVPLQRDKRGYESQFSTNHLGQFQLTAKLWPALKKANGARVVTVSSFGHQMAPFNFDDPHFAQRPYETLQGYGQSKTANNLFAVELDHRGKAFGVRAFSLHPGSVNGTDLGRVAPMVLFQQMGTHDKDGNIFPEVAAKLKTVPQGAATTVWCATSPQLNDLGGVYCEDGDIAELDEGNIEHNYNELSSLRGVKATGNVKPIHKTHVFRKHPLLESCLASLIPYFDLEDGLPANIASIKIEEAISILRLIDRNLDSLLANFEEPGKINITDFMERHYMFNMPLTKFSYLTGRSVATFRRDFIKAFQMTPQKWLTERRLELAHYQIEEKQSKPIDVYFEVGFENLSHFSHAFKKHFGYAPNAIHNRKTGGSGN